VISYTHLATTRHGTDFSAMLVKGYSLVMENDRMNEKRLLSCKKATRRMA
jgi:hypothetical protein